MASLERWIRRRGNVVTLVAMEMRPEAWGWIGRLNPRIFDRLLVGVRRRGWTSHDPGSRHGIRPRVGVNHQTRADFFQAFLKIGLILKDVEEPGEEDYPILLSVVARRPGAGY